MASRWRLIGIASAVILAGVVGFCCYAMWITIRRFEMKDRCVMIAYGVSGDWSKDRNLTEALARYTAANPSWPTNLAGMPLDIWGTAVEVKAVVEKDAVTVTASSAGPDRQWGTWDDVRLSCTNGINAEHAPANPK